VDDGLDDAAWRGRHPWTTASMRVVAQALGGDLIVML
jgi:hypothetical protein